MKKIVFALVAAFVMSLTTNAQAVDVNMTVGVKTWVGTWDTNVYGSIVGSDDIDESDVAMMYGPSINFQFWKFFLGSTYLKGGFDFEDIQEDNGVTNGTDSEDRKDLDLVFGFKPIQYFGFFLGYKKIDYKYDIDLTIPSASLRFINKGDAELDGPVFGVTGNVPLGNSGIVLLGTLSYMKLDSEGIVPASENNEFDGVTLEFGLGWTSARVPISVSASLKYQYYEQNESKPVEDDFFGIMLGFNYAFSNR